MGTTRNILFTTLAMALAACAPIENEEPDAGEDVGVCPDNYPAGPYGSSVGRKFAPVTLPDCDGNDYAFANEDFCNSKLTVVSVAAEWCVPCQQESSKMTDYLTEPYRDRGVRVMQIIVQNKTGGAPDSKLCKEWVSRYDLTNIEVIDPDGLTSAVFPTGSLPSTLIVDSKGVIRHREDGFSSGEPFVGLRAKLDQLLEE